MTTEDSAGAAPVLPAGRFSGRSEFRQLVRDALAVAAREGWHELILSDATFEDWPLGERAVDESLHAWSKSGRRIVVMAKHFDEVSRQHARFVTWRRTWAHLIECHGCRGADALDFPSAIWSSHWVMRRLDLEHSVGISGAEPERRIQLKETLDEWLHRSTPAFPANTLGL